MSQQGPILIVSHRESHALAALADVKTFPMIEAGWPEAADAIARLNPAAVTASDIGGNESALSRLAQQTAKAAPYLPLIALDPGAALPPTALPFTRTSQNPQRLVSRLNAALRVRSLHATLLRRLPNNRASVSMPTGDPLDDATILLLGRGGSYPALSVALGERMGVIGALSIEIAARHLNARELDGIVIGDGFTPRVVDAFLTVLSEDSRFRHLPVVAANGSGLAANYDLPNLEIVADDPPVVAAHACPLIRQQAFEARIIRAAVVDTQTRGSGLSVVRIFFARGEVTERMRLDAARILSRLMRRMDFATLDETGAIVVVFPETDLRNAHGIGRRLASVLKHTMYNAKREQRLDPQVALATLMPGDTASSVISRLHSEAHRAAS